MTRVHIHVDTWLEREREREISFTAVLARRTHTYPAKFTIDLSHRDQLVIKLDAEQPTVTPR